MQALTTFNSQSYIVHNPRSVTLIFAQYNLTTVKYVSKYANIRTIPSITAITIIT